MTARIVPAGERAVQVVLGDRVDPLVNARVHALAQVLRQKPLHGVTEVSCAFCTVYIAFDPAVVAYPWLRLRLWRRLHSLRAVGRTAGRMRVLHVPVCYGGAHGPDLWAVAAHAGLDAGEVIRRHIAPLYTIYMLGFLPGFAYLGGLDEALHTPRLATPRTQIPAGAVGIGGGQTGIYPVASPGGWQLIGSTPLRPYDPARTPPVLYGAGDGIRFHAVDESTYDMLCAQVAAGQWTPDWREEEVAHDAVD